MEVLVITVLVNNTRERSDTISEAKRQERSHTKPNNLALPSVGKLTGGGDVGNLEGGALAQLVRAQGK